MWNMLKMLALVIAVTLIIGVGAAVLGGPLMWYQASVQAETYNRLTGRDLTTWEALWTDVRVDCN